MKLYIYKINWNQQSITNHYISLLFFIGNINCQLKGNQDDPCKTKSRLVPDEVYCDRYWECVNGQPELYDCPNGLVFAGKNRGVTEGCDYPWRSNYCEGKQQASKILSHYLLLCDKSFNTLLTTYYSCFRSSNRYRSLRLVVRNIWPRIFLHKILDLLEWYSNRTIMYWWIALQ